MDRHWLTYLIISKAGKVNIILLLPMALLSATMSPSRSFASQMELMAALMTIDEEQVLVVLIYRPPVTDQQLVNQFIDELKDQLDELDVGMYNTIVLGDFNLDQMHNPYVELFQDICSHFSFVQRSNYSTHIHGGILDLVFQNKRCQPVDWVPSPYSDHFILIVDVWWSILQYEFHFQSFLHSQTENKWGLNEYVEVLKTSLNFDE